MSQEDKRSLKKIKSSIFDRTLSLTKFTIGASSRVIAHNISTLLDKTDLKSEKWNELLKTSASSLSIELGQLKGSLMKAGQMLSMYGELFLPAEANQFLKTLQSQSPPLVFEEIQKILSQELGSKINELQIETRPIGAASMGQVHKAVHLQSHRVLALKVQYPGVEQAISSDLKSLKTLLSVLKLLPSELQTKTLFDEVESMLRQELQYELEFKQTQIYRDRLLGDLRYVVPEPISEFSGPRVLATTFEEGIAPDDSLIQSLSQDRRNALAESFLDLYFRELFSWGVIQTDPHLGNYKIRLGRHPSLTPFQKDENQEIPLEKSKAMSATRFSDQWVLLDFGAVREYPTPFLNAYRKLIRAAALGDLVGIEQASYDLQFLNPSDPPELKKIFQEFCLLTVEPFLSPETCPSPFFDSQGFYDWKKSDLPQRLTQIGLKIVKQFPLRTPPREIIFLDRKTGGVFIVLSVLGAKIKGKEILKKYL